MTENVEVEKASGDVAAEAVIDEPSKPEVAKVPDVELIVDGFGFMPSGKRKSKGSFGEEEKSPCASSTNIDIVRRYTWKTKNRMTVQLITYGATVTSISVPNKLGVSDDIIAGFETLEEYFQNRNPYFGATIGRYASYVCDGTMVVRPSGRMYMLSTNKGHHHYNGGRIGFDKVNWRSYVTGNKVILSHVSERFHEGYPGTMMTQISFEVTCDNTIQIEMKCSTSEPTIVNLSHCLFFNLAGHQAGKEQMYEHILTINADKYTPACDDGVPTGEKKVVGGTAYDFRVPRLIRAILPKVSMGGYDVNYCVTKGVAQDLTFQARAVHPVSGRVVEVYSNQPGMQFYTGNLLPDPNKLVESIAAEEEETETQIEKKDMEYENEASSVSSVDVRVEEDVNLDGENMEKIEEEQGKPDTGYVPLKGNGGATYNKHGLFCLMPQNYPDSINHKNFPNSVLNPGEVYIHKIEYKFGLLLGRYV